ncbi:MAG: hypothetical protein U1D30_24490 [Planctomycetota bacterium]
MPKFNKKEKDTLETFQYQFISLAKARRKGILPIAFDSNERLNTSNAKQE